MFLNFLNNNNMGGFLMKNKLLVVVLLFLLTVSTLTGCAKSADTSANYPEKPINMIVAFGPGGGSDIGARMVVPFVEEELGVTINVINKPGAAGWVGWTDLVKAKPDGYTIGMINSPSMISGYLDPQYNREEDLDSFDLIALQVLDLGAFAINPNDTRFTNAEELIEYAQKNETTCAQDGVGSDDWMALTRFNLKYNTKFTSVAQDSTAESLAALMGGHVDVVFANVGELKVPHENNEIKIIGVMHDERSSFLPDVPCTKEMGYEVYSNSSRGFAAPAGLDPAVKEKLVDAFEKAITNPEHIEKMKDMGLEVVFMKGEEYKNLLLDDEKGVLEVKWWDE